MKIKKCPFCGEEIKDEFPDLYEMKDGVWILSHYCDMEQSSMTIAIDVYGASKKEAVERWNRRWK